MILIAANDPAGRELPESVFFIFFYVFLQVLRCFLMFCDGFRWFWKGLEGFGRVWKGWGEVGRGGKRWMGPYNTQKPVRPSVRPSAVRPSVRRPSAVRPSAVRPSVRPSYYYYPNGWVCVTLQPPKPRQIVRCLGMLTHARSYPNAFNCFSMVFIDFGLIFDSLS